MKIHNVMQGSAEWLQLRVGIPTASRFDEILTPKTLKYSKGARRYINELVAETLMDGPIERYTTAAMERGIDLEPKARAWYAFDQDLAVETVGFVTNDEGTVGGSPDGLVNEDGGLEIKCPGAIKHVENLFGGEIAKYGQIQGNIFVCEREFWDCLSFHPAMPPALVRVYRDSTYIDALIPALDQFLDELAEAKERAAELGLAGRRETIHHGDKKGEK